MNQINPHVDRHLNEIPDEEIPYVVITPSEVKGPFYGAKAALSYAQEHCTWYQIRTLVFPAGDELPF